MNRKILLVVMLFLVGCSVIPNEGDDELVTPTTHPLFIEPLTAEETESPMVAADGTPAATSAPGNTEVLVTVTPTPLPTAAPAPVPANGAIAVEPIYGDSLSEAWQLYRIDEIDINLEYTNRTHGGESAISFVAPSRDGRMLFTFQEDAETAYRWDEVVGLSFWIRSNGGEIPSSAISIGVLGSDEVNYWRAGDSVTYTDSNLPIETNLLAWGIDRQIPTNSWLEVTVDLNSLMQSETFEWFTGFYLRSDTGPSAAILIDDINLIVFVENE